jgi:mannosidase alpha-like ER degradation enhancer 3
MQCSINYLFYGRSGLLSGHVLADKIKRRGDVLQWYNNELLDLAKDLGYRMLPAFNTSTGIPYPRVSVFSQCIINS